MTGLSSIVHSLKGGRVILELYPGAHDNIHIETSPLTCLHAIIVLVNKYATELKQNDSLVVVVEP